MGDDDGDNDVAQYTEPPPSRLPTTEVSLVFDKFLLEVHPDAHCSLPNSGNTGLSEYQS